MFNIHIWESLILPLSSLGVESEVGVLDLSIAKCARLNLATSNRSLQMVLARNDSKVRQGEIPRVAARD